MGADSVLRHIGHRYSKIFQGDRAIWAIYFIFCAISLIEVYSATSSLSYKTGNFIDPVLRHGLFILGGICMAVAAHHIPSRWFKFYPFLMIPISAILLIVLLAKGAMTNNAARWITIFGMKIQPSEFAKGAVVAAVAFILSALQTEKGADRHAFKYILWVTVPICLLIFPENFSTAGLLFLVVLMIMFIGRVPLAQMGKLLGVLAIIASLGIAVVAVTPQATLNKIPKMHRLATWKGRLADFSEKKNKPLSVENIDLSGQETHAKIAIATSHIIGKFPGNSVERDFLSQAFSDFIFAIIIEEMGLIGGFFVLMLYIILLFRASKIANRCERPFPAFLVLGLALLIVTQALINMSVAVGLMPVTGQPLPFISRGGTSTIMNGVYIGMILSVSRFAKRRSVTPKVVEEVPEDHFNEEEFTSDKGMD
ncbi:MAG: FtsW/RodA/SpoVE family cell cycle protein [Bacteroidaceae bacterium]|nr:FtsW/RodA/SpoVE family cell cycle protein [Bacteroidaceae bacterium]